MTEYDAQLAMVTSNFSLTLFLGGGRARNAWDWSDIRFESLNNHAKSENGEFDGDVALTSFYKLANMLSRSLFRRIG